jgi:hypothetical protein
LGEFRARAFRLKFTYEGELGALILDKTLRTCRRGCCIHEKSETP